MFKGEDGHQFLYFTNLDKLPENHSGEMLAAELSVKHCKVLRFEIISRCNASKLMMLHIDICMINAFLYVHRHHDSQVINLAKKTTVSLSNDIMPSELN